MKKTTPEREWLDRREYPFASHFVEVDAGRMHYVDEGAGRTLLLVHGTPTWSFLYRHLIRDLSRGYRVVAPDHLGFGLSDKPAGWPARPADHARNLERFIETLGLDDFVLAVHDFGGPIGLSCALARPEKIAGLVLFNTWMWSLADDRSAALASRIFGGRFGRFLYERFNFSARFLLGALFSDKTKLTPNVHRHYTEVFPTPADRRATWVFARELIGSSDWYARLWDERERLRDKPALLLWGLRDRAFQTDALRRWQELFAHERTVELPDAGHFVPEESPTEAARAIDEFVRSLPPARRPPTAARR